MNKKYDYYKRDGEKTYGIYEIENNGVVDGFEDKQEMLKELKRLNREAK